MKHILMHLDMLTWMNAIDLFVLVLISGVNKK